MAKVLIKTSEGDIKVRLYDETPQHRDNFLKLAKEGYFDGTLFHRVIKDFMIQGGDPDSKGCLLYTSCDKLVKDIHAKGYKMDIQTAEVDADDVEQLKALFNSSLLYTSRCV